MFKLDCRIAFAEEAEWSEFDFLQAIEVETWRKELEYRLTDALTNHIAAFSHLNALLEVRVVFAGKEEAVDGEPGAGPDSAEKWNSVVLSIDDGPYVRAARAAVSVFARRVRLVNEEIADQLEAALSEFPNPWHEAVGLDPALIKPSFVIPEQQCSNCGNSMEAVATDGKQEWEPFFQCPECGAQVTPDCDLWPFQGTFARCVDWETAGFRVV